MSCSEQQKYIKKKNNLKFGTLSGNKWVEQMKGTFFTGCMSNLFFESSVVIFCCTLVHEFALLFYCSRNYTAIIERKIACITVNFEWIPNFASKQHSRSRLPLKFPSREQTELKRRCHVMFCGGNKTLVSNITAPWWSELPRGWKEAAPQKDFFRPFGPHFGPKIRGVRVPQAPPLDTPLLFTKVPLWSTFLLLNNFYVRIISYQYL